MLKFALICLFLFINFFYSEGKTPAIINGTEVRDDEALFFVGITIYKGPLVAICGGALIAENKVLTAAHCVKGLTIPGLVLIKYGTKNRLDNTKEIRASKIVKHPEFNPISLLNDVAVITLSEPIKEASNVKYAQLQTEESKIGDKYTLYGWGRINVHKDGSEPNVNPPRLLKATLTLTERQGNVLIFTDPIQTECDGDSGGPVVSPDGKVAAIVSWGNKRCLPGTKSGYTSVRSYIDFIKNNLK